MRAKILVVLCLAAVVFTTAIVGTHAGYTASSGGSTAIEPDTDRILEEAERKAALEAQKKAEEEKEKSEGKQQTSPEAPPSPEGGTEPAESPEPSGPPLTPEPEGTEAMPEPADTGAPQNTPGAREVPPADSAAA